MEIGDIRAVRFAIPVQSSKERLVFIRMSCTTLAVLVLPSMLEPTHAGGIESMNCVGQYGAFSCATVWGWAGDPHIRTVPSPGSAQKEAEFAKRDRKWLARCRPVVEQDRYGVSRYHYAAPGCEFGVIGANVGYFYRRK
jgi:hypothetical protein